MCVLVDEILELGDGHSYELQQPVDELTMYTHLGYHGHHNLTSLEDCAKLCSLDFSCSGFQYMALDAQCVTLINGSSVTTQMYANDGGLLYLVNAATMVTKGKPIK